MKLHFLLLVLFNIFRVQCTEPTSKGENDEKVENIAEDLRMREPFYPHRVGIMNPRYNCYMNAVFSCLYNIPFFQDTVYRIVENLPDVTEILEAFGRPGNIPSTLMSLADIFVKMRTSSQAVKLDKTMFPAIRQSMGWSVGEYQCVLEFWGSFVETMPERFKELFQVKVSTNYIRKRDNRLLKSIPDIYNYINIPVPSETISISSILSNHFLDEEVEDYTILPSDQNEYGDLFSEPLTEKISIPVKSTVTFTNKPNVLVFGVKRLNYNFQSGEYELNEVPVNFDNVNLDGETYVPVASVIFSKQHYYAIVKDISFGDLFLHNDFTVQYVDMKSNLQDISLLDEILKRKSVLVFYIKLSGLSAFKGDYFVDKKTNKDIPSCLLNLQSKKKAAKVLLSQEEGEKRKAQKRKSTMSSSSFDKSKKRKSIKKIRAIAIESASTEPVISENSETFQNEKVEEENSDIDLFSFFSSSEENEFEEDSSRNEPVSTDYPPVAEPDQATTETDQATNETDKATTEYLKETDEIAEEKKIPEIDSSPNSYPVIENILDMPLLLQPYQQQQQLQHRQEQQVSPHPVKSHLLYNAKQKQEKPVKQANYNQCVQRTPYYQHPKLKYPFFEPVMDVMEKELQVYISRLHDPKYIIGRESYTFSYAASSTRNYSLECVLSAFASNSHVVMKFFALASKTESLKLENLISTVLVQMLIGAKNISLDQLNFHLQIYGLDQKEDVFIKKFFKLLFILSSNLSPELMPIVNFKRIIYSELETDEPIEIKEAQAGIPFFKSNDILLPRPANISGLFIDSVGNQNRVRNVLNSTGLIFPVVIYRYNSDKKLIFDHEIFTHIADYSIIGGVLFDENEIYSEFCSTHTGNSSLKFGNETGGAFYYHQNDEKFMQYFIKFMETIRKRSLVLFVVKRSCCRLASICAKEIPLSVAKNALYSIQESIFRPLENKKKAKGTVKRSAATKPNANRPSSVYSKDFRQEAAQQASDKQTIVPISPLTPNSMTPSKSPHIDGIELVDHQESNNNHLN